LLVLLKCCCLKTIALREPHLQQSFKSHRGPPGLSEIGYKSFFMVAEQL